MALNTTTFVAGQPSTLSVDGVITGTSSPLVITGACVELRFDPTKVTISNLRTDSSTGWELLAYNTDNTADGWIRTAMFNNLNPGQTTTGPILLFTVTPANSSVNVNDCATLRFSGSESDFCDDGFYDYIPSDPCEGIYAPQGEDMGNTPATQTQGGLRGGITATTTQTTSLNTFTPDCPVNVGLAADILRIAGGLATSSLDDMDTLDRNHDGYITMIDAFLVLRDPCAVDDSAPVGWYTLQGNRSRTGRARDSIDLSGANNGYLWHMDFPLPSGYTPVSYDNPYSDENTYMDPSPVVIPDPVNPSMRDTFVIISGIGPGGEASFLFRVKETSATGVTLDPTTPVRLYADPNNIDTTKRYPVYAVGTPLVVGGRIFITGYSIGVAGVDTNQYPYVLAYDARTLNFLWARRLPYRYNIGAVNSSPGWSPYNTQYTDPSGTQTHVGGCVLVASDADYIYLENGVQYSSISGFLFALDPTNGKNVWGNVDADGNLVLDHQFGPLSTPNHVREPRSAGGGQASLSGTSPGGLPPMAGPSTQSSPSSDTSVAYTADDYGFVNARDLTTGNYLWDASVDGNDIESSVSVQNYWAGQANIARLYYGSRGSEEVSMAAGPAGGLVEWELDSNSLPMGQVFSTPAILRDSGRVFINDIQGQMLCVDYADSNPLNTDLKWYRTLPGGSIDNIESWASPLVAPGTIPGHFNVYLSGVDQFVHVMDASPPGIPPVTADLFTLGDPNAENNSEGLLNSTQHCSLAAWAGRLFILTPATYPTGTGTQYPARLLCYGR
jgi:hypothetical protein